jgi:tRNA nucleotidyltransferase/poly(A) polymerase
VRQEIEKYVRSLGLDAYLVGGAVRDELLGLESKDADFLVPGSTPRGCGLRSPRTGASRISLSPTGSSGSGSIRATPRSAN